jgi:hypothetical protein
VRCADTGSPNTLSRTLTGSTVVSSATTWPGRCSTICLPVCGCRAADRAYRGREPPGPNQSAQARFSVQYDGTTVSGPCRSATYWRISRSRVRMLSLDLCSTSWRTA